MRKPITKFSVYEAEVEDPTCAAGERGSSQWKLAIDDNKQLKCPIHPKYVHNEVERELLANQTVHDLQNTVCCKICFAAALR